MFGASSGHEAHRGVGEIASIAASAAAGFAVVLALTVQILSPLDQALRALARERFPVFEEEILVEPPERLLPGGTGAEPLSFAGPATPARRLG